MNILVIDNFDSFIYNFVDSIQKLGHQVEVVRNSISLNALKCLLEDKNFDGIVLSPGPGRPEQAGICIDLVKALNGKLPIFGICLGHQAIGAAFDVAVVQSAQPTHGKRSALSINSHPIFKGLEADLQVGRYHSLIVETLPVGFELLASNDNEIQAMIHPQKGLLGFQFHPESALTINGDALIKNVLEEMALMANKLNEKNGNLNESIGSNQLKQSTVSEGML
jgi:anthranilate synthase component II